MDEIMGDVFEIRNERQGKKGVQVPTNIKQIGNIEGTFQVYMEDFVYSYLKEMSSIDGSKERLAVLVGKYAEQDGQQIVLIRGAINGQHTAVRKGSVVFTEKSWETIYEEKEKYFPNEEIIGWMRSQPGFGVFLSGYDQEFHETFFQEDYQLAYVVDPIEKTDAFFQWKNNQIKKMYGYFIYYDKNNAMHEYMVDHRIAPEKTEKNTKEEFIRQLRRQEKIKKNEKIYKRTIQGLTGMSAGLVLVCAALGAGIYRTKEKLEAVSSQYEALNIKLELLSRQTEETQKAFSLQPSEEKNITEKAQTVIQKEPEPKAAAPESKAAAPEVKAAAAPKPVEQQKAAATSTQKPQAKAVEVKYENYVVKTGDSLLGIALKHYGDGNMMRTIMQINGMDNPDKLVSGQKLKLPIQ